jgi:hypothetical protein
MSVETSAPQTADGLEGFEGPELLVAHTDALAEHRYPWVDLGAATK